MADVQQSLRNIRIIHFAFLAAAALLFFATSIIPTTGKARPPFLAMLLAALAVSEAGIATAFRSKLIRPSVERLQQSPQDSAALAQWQRGNILSFAFAFTIVLYGVATRVLGFSWTIAVWFFVAGFLLLVLWTPRLQLPSSTNAPGSSPPPVR